MRHKKGFSLLSFLVYLLCSSIIVCCLYSIVTTTILPCLRSIESHKKQLALILLSDLFVKEIRTSTIALWKVVQPAVVIWNDGEKDICWRLHKKRVERIEGVYKNDNWHKKTTSVIRTNIDYSMFNYDYKKGKIVGIEWAVSYKNTHSQVIHSYVAVRS
jgi:hypothetical protein